MKKKTPFLMFCKTYRKDIERFEVMLQSFKKYNVDNIKLYISVQETELSFFYRYKSKNIFLISDESYAKAYFINKSYWNLSLGYINQEICKLAFWEASKCENYLCIDSDAYFIRRFYMRDFMYSKHIPYSVLVMDKDLQTEFFYRDFGKWRRKLIKKIFKKIGLNDKRYRTCHGMQVINCKIMKNFKSTFMKEKKYKYKDLIRISPYEFTWYNAWLQKSKIIPVIAVEPFFKTYHSRIEYIFARLRKIKEEYLAEQYVGIVMNSNWVRRGIIQFKNLGFLERIIYKLINNL